MLRSQVSFTRLRHVQGRLYVVVMVVMTRALKSVVFVVKLL